MLRSKFAWILSVAGGISIGLAAPIEGKLEGWVNAENGQGLRGALVVARTKPGDWMGRTATDATGHYELSGVPAGRIVVQVSAAGFLAQELEIPVENQADRRRDFQLKPGVTLEPVRGAEERNPNSFISKIDLNAVRDLMRRQVIDPVYLDFAPDQSAYGAEFGSPLRRIFVAHPVAGSRDFHGSLSWSHQNSALNARPFFNVGPLLPSRRNLFGWSGGGPVVRNLLQLSGSVEVLRESGFVNGNVRVPLASERTPQADPETAQIISALLRGYPDEEPNLPWVLERQLNTNAERTIRSFGLDTRADLQLSQRHAMAARYVLSDYFETPFELVAGENPQTELRPQSLSMTSVFSASPDLVLRNSAYGDRQRALLLPTERFRELLAPIGLSDVPDIDFGGDFADLSALGPGSQFPRRRFQNRFGGSSDVSLTRGAHQVRVGGSVLRVQTNDLQSDNTRGKFLFSNNFGRTALENFLSGTPTRFTITLGDLYRGFRHSQFSFYLVDLYRVAPNLQLSLGLRYELVTAPIEVNGLTQFPFSADTNNWSPQIAFAWSPGGGRIIVRGGYGISYGEILPATYQLARFNPPEVQTISIQNPRLHNPLQDVDLTSSRRKSELRLLSPDLVSPYVHQYNLRLQKEFRGTVLEVGYIGSRSIKLFFPYVSNRAEPVPGIPSTTATIDARRPDPRFQSIRTIINSGVAYYDALKAQIRGKSFGDLALDLTYVWSKALTSGYEFYNTLNAEKSVGVSQNNEDFHADLKSPSEIDAKHSLVLNSSYLIPAPGWVPGRLLQGWRVTGSFSYRSGNWFNLTSSSDAPGFGNVDGEGDDRPNLLNPAILGMTVNDPDTSSTIFDPAFFDTNIPPGGRGNIGYRVFKKDNLSNINLSLRRDFDLSENSKLLVRTDFYNLLNHPQFQRPGDVIPSPTFGKIVDTQNKGRVMQLSVEFKF